MLLPGIHLTLPFPFARTTQFPVDKMKAMTVGFVADPLTLSTQPMLWTKPHGEAEFPLVVGDGTELVAINAVVQYRVANHAADLKSYVTFARDPDAMLRSLSQHVLMAETRTLTLQGLLSADRTAWGQQIRQHLQDEIARHHLGLEVIQFDVLSIHPPIEVAESFLDIVAARIDAEKEVLDAQAAWLTERRRCEMMAATDAADASAAASVRLTAVMDEALHLEALASVDEGNSSVFRRRAFCDAFAEVLTDRTITLIDQKLPVGPETLAGFTAGNSSGGGSMTEVAADHRIRHFATRTCVARVGMAVLMLLLFAVYDSFFTVTEGEAVVITRFGRPTREITQAGPYWKFPAPIEQRHVIDRRRSVFTAPEAAAFSADKRSIVLTCFVIWHVEKPLTYLQSVGDTETAQSRLTSMFLAAQNQRVGTFPLSALASTSPEDVQLSQMESLIREDIAAVSSGEAGHRG